MNRFIYLGNYVVASLPRDLYYDEDMKGFYALPQGYYEEHIAPNLQDEEDSEYIEDYEIDDYLIKDANEIRVLSVLLEKKKKLMEKEKKQKEARDRKTKKAIKFGRGVITLACLAYIFSTAHQLLTPKIKENIEDMIDDLELDDEKISEYMEDIDEALESNKTIPNNIRVRWHNSFVDLFSHSYIPEYRMRPIIKRLKTGVFDDLDDQNQIKYFAHVLFNSEDAVACGLVYQLNSQSSTYYLSQSRPFGLLSSVIDEDVLNDVFVFGTDAYVDKLAEKYHCSKGDIESFLRLLKSYYNSQDYEERDSLYTKLNEQLKDLLLGYYQNKEKTGEFDRLLLASLTPCEDDSNEIYVDFNIFNEKITVSVYDDIYQNYKLYFDTLSKEDISEDVYTDKLANLINHYGYYIDYENSNCRFLVYLYYLSYRDVYTFNHNYLFDAISSKDLAFHIMTTAFDDNGNVNMNRYFLYSYLSSSKVNLTDLLNAISYTSDDAVSASLYVEYMLCLKEEVKAGNLTEQEYDEYKEYITRSFRREEELYDITEEALRSNSSLLKNFKIPNDGDFSYTNDEIKEYIYEPIN